jgi:hypothetical protein
MNSRDQHQGLEGQGDQTFFIDSEEKQSLSRTSTTPSPRLPIYSGIGFHLFSTQETEKLEEMDPPIGSPSGSNDFEDGIEKPISQFFHLALDESIQNENPYRLFSGLMPFALGALGASYSFVRSALTAVWTLFTLPVEIGREQREKITTLAREFSVLLYELNSHNSALKHQALLKLYRIIALIAQTILESLQQEWDEAQSTDQVLELLGKWSATGVLTFSSTGTVKLLPKSLQFANQRSLPVPQRVTHKITELEQKIQIFIQENPLAKKQLTIAAHEIATSASTTSKPRSLKTTVPRSRAPVQQHETARIVDSAERVGAFYSEAVLKGAKKYGISTQKGIEVYARLHEAIQALPNELKKSKGLKNFKALSIKRIREGNDPNKIAIIGRVMGQMDGSDIGVYAVKEHFKKYGIEIKSFQMRDEIWKEFLRSAKVYRQHIGNPSAMLPPSAVIKTKAYEANKSWANLLKRYGYTVLDMGDPLGKNEFSIFYSIEKKTLFGK